jgi:hypothetical protein
MASLISFNLADRAVAHTGVLSLSLYEHNAGLNPSRPKKQESMTVQWAQNQTRSSTVHSLLLGRCHVGPISVGPTRR